MNLPGVWVSALRELGGGGGRKAGLYEGLVCSLGYWDTPTDHHRPEEVVCSMHVRMAHVLQSGRRSVRLIWGEFGAIKGRLEACSVGNVF